MSKVKALRNTDVNPTIILNSVHEILDTLESITIVTINKEGMVQLWAAADLQDLCFMSKHLEELISDYIKGRLNE